MSDNNGYGPAGSLSKVVTAETEATASTDDTYADGLLKSPWLIVAYFLLTAIAVYGMTTTRAWADLRLKGFGWPFIWGVSTPSQELREYLENRIENRPVLDLTDAASHLGMWTYYSETEVYFSEHKFLVENYIHVLKVAANNYGNLWPSKPGPEDPRHAEYLDSVVTR